jgi:hypothetical protein
LAEGYHPRNRSQTPRKIPHKIAVAINAPSAIGIAKYQRASITNPDRLHAVN